MGVLGLIILAGIFGIFLVVLSLLLLKVVNRVTETNKHLMIIVAGKDDKPETLRALVASNKPPKKNLPGIAGKKDGDKKPANTDYKMSIGIR